jgi:hypothetical protein
VIGAVCYFFKARPMELDGPWRSVQLRVRNGR